MNSSNLKYYNTFILISKERKCSFSFAQFCFIYWLFNVFYIQYSAFHNDGCYTYLQQKYAYTWHRLDMRKIHTEMETSVKNKIFHTQDLCFAQTW